MNRIILPQTCVACFVAHAEVPEGDLGIIFLAGYVAGGRPYPGDQIHLCPKHSTNLGQMKSAETFNVKLKPR